MSWSLVAATPVLQDKIQICLYCIFKSEHATTEKKFLSVLGITEIDKLKTVFGSPAKQENVTF